MNYRNKMCMPLGGVLLMVLLLVAGCSKEEMTFTSFIAEMDETQQDAGKTCMVDESFVYWEEGDQIDVRYETKSDVDVATFSYSSDGKQAVFSLKTGIKVPEGEPDNYIALFPHNDNNNLGSKQGDPISVVFPSEQGWRNVSSFASAACPMVAYGTRKGTDGLVRLQFHNLAGLVRLQIINSETDATLKDAKLVSLEVTTASSSNKIAGNFTVNNYDQYAPSLSGGTGDKISITPDAGKEPSLKDTGLVFYLALPAKSGSGNTTYGLNLRVKVKGSDNNVYHVDNSFAVQIRRNGITKMPSLHCTQWTKEEGEHGSSSAHITGCGTDARPFLIYTIDDLVELRDVYNSNVGYLNGFALGPDTKVRVMRSDIVLTSSNWTEPFRDFDGYFTYGGTQSGSAGITNNSGRPIFTKVSGTVEGFTVRGKKVLTVGSTVDTAFSLLCITVDNGGTLFNCVAGDADTVVVVGSTKTKVGGVCVTNNGTLMGCGCRALLVAEKVGGLCVTNNGTITNSYVVSPMSTRYTHNGESNHATEAGGICHTCIDGTVSYCYFAANTNMSNTRWGGIVHTLTGGELKNCYIDAAGIIQSNNGVGGIVHTMSGGVVDYCWNNADLVHVENEGLGGIVYELTAGEVRNCRLGAGTGMLKCLSGVMGGFVARMSGGTVYNSCAYGDPTQTISSVKGAFVGQLTGGTIVNCYGLQNTATNAPSFCGQKSGGTVTHCYSHAGDNGTTAYGTFSDLCTGLNGWTGAPSASTYRTWSQTGTNPPVHTTSYFPLQTKK